MSLSIDFISKECKNNGHFLCSRQWEGFGFTIICSCNCHKEIDEKNIVLDEPCKPSNIHCMNHILNLSVEGDD